MFESRTRSLKGYVLFCESIKEIDTSQEPNVASQMIDEAIILTIYILLVMAEQTTTE